MRDVEEILHVLYSAGRAAELENGELKLFEMAAKPATGPERIEQLHRIEQVGCDENTLLH